jgi:UDP-N-acetylglucosamine 2-epimerase
MEYGPHTDAVNDILDWIDSRNLLRFGETPDHSFVVVHSFEDAIQMARSQSGSRINWTELRDNADAMMYSVGLLDEPEWEPYKDKIEDLLLVVDKKVNIVLPTHYRRIIDDVVADLHACARCLAVNGQLDSFHLSLWKAYLTGGWPCGASGQSDSYKLLLFWKIDRD